MSEINSQLLQEADRIVVASQSFLDFYGLTTDPYSDPEGFEAALSSSNPRFDGQHHGPRFMLAEDAAKDQVAKPIESTSVVMDTARQLGMLEPETKLQGDFELVVALAGARRATYDRAGYAVSALESGAASTRRLVIAGTDRLLNDKERQAVEAYAPGAQTEWDLCLAAQSELQESGTSQPMDVAHLEQQRAHTAALIEHVVQAALREGSLQPGERLAAVTHQIYRPATVLDVARAAEQLGITETFVAGAPSDPRVVAGRTADTYRAEILRTLRAAAKVIQVARA